MKDIFVSSVYQCYCMVISLIICWMIMTVSSHERLADRFVGLDGEQILEMWHTDCNSACGVFLREYINIACKNDPYRITTNKRSANHPEHAHKDLMLQTKKPFLTKRSSSMFLSKLEKHGHSIFRRGITEECCLKSCSWDEFANYCWGRPESAPRRPSVCA